MPKSKKFKFISQKIPTQAGCYLFYDAANKLLYVGKATNLRQRVRSYFSTQKASHRIAVMTSKIAKIETQVVSSEIDALILENQIIKTQHPRFNVKLRDDKDFIYLRLTNEDEPRMEIVRRPQRDGDTYIGPKTNSKAFRQTVRFCQKFFAIRMVKESQNYYPHLAADHQLHGAEYRDNVEQMLRFLRGYTREVLSSLRAKMFQQAKDKNFEAAASLRDTIQAIEASTGQQNIILSDHQDRDFWGGIRHSDVFYAVRIVFRDGRWCDKQELTFSAPSCLNDEEVWSQAVETFYILALDHPKQICLPVDMAASPSLAAFFLKKSSSSISFHCPQRGKLRRLMDIAHKNALHYQKTCQLEALSTDQNITKALPELATALGIDHRLDRIEGFDISHLGGSFPVASQVVFTHGVANNSQYRRFTVKDLPLGQIDDTAAMGEILRRRFLRLLNVKNPAQQPDLLIIDGGRGQLNSVLRVLESPEFTEIAAVYRPRLLALAKREEEVYRPDEDQVLKLPRDSAALKLLQRVRDEAHRFGVTFNQAKRKKDELHSSLDSVPGIGATTRQKLLRRFGSSLGVREASDDELSGILNAKQLLALREHFG